MKDKKQDNRISLFYITERLSELTKISNKKCPKWESFLKIILKLHRPAYPIFGFKNTFKSENQ